MNQSSNSKRTPLVRTMRSECTIVRCAFDLVILGLAYFALAAPEAFAVSPAPDGGYAGANTAEGTNALNSLTSGSSNTAIGFQVLFNNTSGSGNTAAGLDALLHNTTGIDNTAVGFEALLNNTVSGGSTAIGFSALANNTTGNDNTATGSDALLQNTSGNNNTASGVAALQANSTGNNNTATGCFALLNNSTGGDNTATGDEALESNTTGFSNTVAGALALLHNTTGSHNTADGVDALLINTTGGDNTAIGFGALLSNSTADSNTAIGFEALQLNTTGANNIAVGTSAGSNLSTGNNNIDIGNTGVAGESGKIRIGKQGAQNGTFIAGIAGTAVTGSAVVVSSTGKLGVATSSARFKEQIQPMDKASKAILALKPVTFRYKEDVDPDRASQFGLVAEEVEKVDPDLVVHDEEGKPFTVRYEAVNAMLLNEFLKEHRKVEQQETRLGKQEATIAQQQKQIEALAAGLQKVSATVELNKVAPTQVVDNR